MSLFSSLFDFLNKIGKEKSVDWIATTLEHIYLPCEVHAQKFKGGKLSNLHDLCWTIIEPKHYPKNGPACFDRSITRISDQLSSPSGHPTSFDLIVGLLLPLVDLSANADLDALAAVEAGDANAPLYLRLMAADDVESLFIQIDSLESALEDDTIERRNQMRNLLEQVATKIYDVFDAYNKNTPKND
jgi:hypothetical protein